MSASATLVVELLTEELPPKALARLGDAFAEGIVDGLTDGGFLTAASAIVPYATPRRLAVGITHVLATSPDVPVAQKLMPAAVALDAEGKPTIALRRKLESTGRGRLAERWPDAVEGPDRLARESDGKADAIFLYSVARGRPLAIGLQSALDAALAKLPIPKVMAYAGAGSYYNDVKFVRPAHRLLALHGADVVPVTALGLAADRLTGGHRFLSRDAIAVASADAYEETLRAEGKVIARFAERRATIAAALHKAAAGANVIMPEALQDEVTALVEWPAVYEGSFDRAFLAVPQECLILTMQQNQKYFALADAHGSLLHRFLLVSNVTTVDPDAIVHGNERVLRARLADARFFFDQDRKTKLEARVDRLGTVV
jgi:glycyl-tRNA synthetase beta chain